MMVDRLTRIAVFGCGFWARFQVAAWQELPGAKVVALYNRTRAKAEALGKQFGIDAIYDDADLLLERESIDVVDIITDVDSHAHFVNLAAQRGLPVICQKPLAPDLATAETLVEFCGRARAPLYVHENWRWQTPLRALRQALGEGAIGKTFRARIDFTSGFAVFANQPFLAELERFILADIGTHILDAARFLFGEASSIYCQTHRVHRDIRGEDVATVLLRMQGNDHTRPGATVTCNMGYPENYLERDPFPQTLVFVEGEKGSIELARDYWLRVTTAAGTSARQHPPQRFEWIDPAYEVVQSSIVGCCANLLAAVRGEAAAETTGPDNLKTLRLVFAAYDSAARNAVVNL
jgi:predicted dehydrogenase